MFRKDIKQLETGLILLEETVSLRIISFFLKKKFQLVLEYTLIKDYTFIKRVYVTSKIIAYFFQ